MAAGTTAAHLLLARGSARTRHGVGARVGRDAALAGPVASAGDVALVARTGDLRGAAIHSAACDLRIGRVARDGSAAGGVGAGDLTSCATTLNATGARTTRAARDVTGFPLGTVDAGRAAIGATGYFAGLIVGTGDKGLTSSLSAAVEYAPSGPVLPTVIRAERGGSHFWPSIKGRPSVRRTSVQAWIRRTSVQAWIRRTSVQARHAAATASSPWADDATGSREATASEAAAGTDATGSTLLVPGSATTHGHVRPQAFAV